MASIYGGGFQFIMGLDLGQAQDYTALVILERDELVTPMGATLDEIDGRVRHDTRIVDQFLVRHIERFPLGTSYPDIVERVQTILHAAPLTDPIQQVRSVVVVDRTGLGGPVIDWLAEAGVGPLVGITITAGNEVSQSFEKGYESLTVPKKELVSALQLFLQSGRLKIAEELPDARLLGDEIQAFGVRLSDKTGQESFEPWRKGAHDDLVLALALALWYASRFGTERMLPELGAKPDHGLPAPNELRHPF